jgi:hypothetical protein
VSLGLFKLPVNVTVDVLNEGTNGYVVADAVQLVRHFDGVIVDDVAAAAGPGWSISSATPGYVGEWYRHDGNAAKGTRSIRFDATLPAAGRYELFYYYTPNANRASNVPISVNGQKLLLNQRLPTTEGRVSLGRFSFATTAASVEVRTDGTDGYVIADAVQFVAAP